MSTTPLVTNDALASIGSLGSAGASIGVLKEPSDARVSMDPFTTGQLIKEGYKVFVQQGAGVLASFSDDAYKAAGAEVVGESEVLKCAVVLRIDPPVTLFAKLANKVVISWVGRLQETGKQTVQQATAARVTLLDVTAIPRITIAQKLDTLSSQAKVAGHRAVLEAAHSFGRFHTSEMTAAGKYPPSATFVLGCGVAGLAAIGTSKALGSIVKAWDVRDVHDQVESMGAQWVKVEFVEDASGQGGYAKESSPEFQKAQKERFEKECSKCDIVITTAAIPGRPSPLLITKEAVAGMKSGSVIVDLAAVGGGNCALTVKDEVITTENGVTIIGYTDLASRMAPQSSAMYAQNMVNLVKHVPSADDVYKKEKGKFVDALFKHLEAGESGDIVSRSIVTCKDGKPVTAPPIPKVPAGEKKDEKVAKKKEPPTKCKVLCDAIVAAVAVTIAVLLTLLMGEGTKVTLIRSFILAGVAGYQAVWGVAHALHTPLMSVTNAISGMTAVGGMILYGKLTNINSGDQIAYALAGGAILVSSINIFGGFTITQRLLNDFKRKGDFDFSALMVTPGIVLSVWAVLNGGNENEKELCQTLSAVFCILAIGCLSSHASSNTGCKFGMVGVACAMVTQLGVTQDSVLPVLGVLVGVGALLGLIVGATVNPMKLPQTVAAFHSLVGLAAMVTSIGSYYENPHETGPSVKTISGLLGNFIGGVTLTGSLIAFGKLNGNLKPKELQLPGKNAINIAMLIIFIALSYDFLFGVFMLPKETILWSIAAVSCVMGLHLVASVGGGDMPVCVTVLNSYSGWALAAEGFNLEVPMLAIVGAVIGFSGAILTKIMCDAMNRDILNVIFGGMNVAPPAKKDGKEVKPHRETTTAEVADMLSRAERVVVVPGYGMAVAGAQNPVGEMAKTLRGKGKECTFAIHPVAGRMPGQMNVLLAQAGVDYEWVQEMDEINPSMKEYDVCIVMGANDITNSAAQEVPGCSIWGMPVIEVWKSKQTIFCKRSMAGGYADLDNPVFYKDNTMMLLGDATKTADGLNLELAKAFEQV